MSQRNITLAKIGIIASMLPILILGYSGGPDPRHTGAPGDRTCAAAGCHVGAGNPTSGSGVEIDFPDGLTYTPGVKQRWNIRITGAQTAAYGFQATARLASNESNGQAGGFSPVDAATQVICEDGRPKQGGTGCRAEAPVEFIEHTAPRNTNSFTVEWTPPATDAGPVRVYVAGNAANGNGQNSGDRIFTANFTLAPKAVDPEPAGPPQLRSEQPVLQAFSGRPGLSAGTWLEIYGTNLAGATREWGCADFTENCTKAPTTLGGVSVNINGKPAFVRFISPNQVNVQAPDDDATGNVTVEVVNSKGRAGVTLQKTKVSPALLTTPLFNVGGRQYVAALHQDFRTFVGREGLIQGVPFRPGKPGDVITVFAVGCGPTNPASQAGQVVSGLRTLASPLQVSFGETAAQAQGFLAPDAIGLCQLNVTVPNVGDGDIRLDAAIDGVASGQTLFTTVQR